MAERTILFADNGRDFLDTRAEFLENAGYRVLKAHTLEQARHMLTSAHVHLAILDIRMVDDDDERDTSGLTLAKDPAFRPLPKIILTNFPTTDAAVEALRVQMDGRALGCDFLDKKDGPEELVEAVARAFARHVHLNWNLFIHWDLRERLSFLHLASLLQPNLPGDVLVHRAEELEDLIRILYYAYQQIRINRLLWQDGSSFCLLVLAQSTQGATDVGVLVCGERDCLELAAQRIQELAPQTALGTELKATAQTVHFGAATYMLPDADVETVRPLGDVFKSGRERPLRAALDHLLKEVLMAWHQRGHAIEETQNLMTLYRGWAGLAEDSLPREEVEKRVAALVHATRPLSAVDVERSEGSITFRFPSQAAVICPDPVTTVYAPLPGYDTPVCKISLGQLTAGSVLVDSNQRAWLTDFAHAGQAPQWWDYVCLEAVVRFDLSQAPDLLAWQEFEECLIKPARLQDRLPERDVIPELRTSVGLIERIRRGAGGETGPDPIPYYAGLLAWTVGAIAHYDPDVLYTRAEQMRGAHLLLASCMLAYRLGETISSHLPEGALRLDDEDTVWIGDNRIATLSGQNLTLLRCLFEFEGRMLTRQEIVERVFGEKYIPGDRHQATRINSLIRRLREEIEPNPDRPRFVVTKRGVGYHLRPESDAGDGALMLP